MDVKTVAPLTEQDLREHALLARIDSLEAEVARLCLQVWHLSEGYDVNDPIAEVMGSIH